MKKALLLLMGWIVTATWATALAASSPGGKDLVDRLGCLSCHSLRGQGGKKGPAWDGAGSRLGPAEIKMRILCPGRGMPSFAHLRPEELDALVQYLSELK
jgi:mono/diheme cytochrome c family protein|uniref:Cytochrome c n=1 Tax=Desulfobacca acetoxidans TaxID=60893 RepID=A0A7C3WSR2_9BACT